MCFIKYVKPSRARHEWAVNRRHLISVVWVRSQANPYCIHSGQPGIYCTILFCVLSFPLSLLCRMYVLFLQTTTIFCSFPTHLSLFFPPFLPSFLNFSCWFRDLVRSCVGTSEVTKLLLGLIILNFFRWGPTVSVFMCWCLGANYVFCSVVFSATLRIYCYMYVYSVTVHCSLECFHNVSVCDAGIILC